MFENPSNLARTVFWNTATVKYSTDVTRLQALVDRKKVVISEAVIREVLRLDDAEGVDCLPNEEIFTGLARMGYEKLSTKLRFYKAFFSSQWKFLIHTILQSMSAKRTSWNEFNSMMSSAVICLSIGRKFNFSKYIFYSLVHNVDSSSKFYMYPRFIQLIIQNQISDLSTHTTKYISLALTQKVFTNIRRIRKCFSRVEMPLFEGMLVVRGDVMTYIEEEHIPNDTVVAAAQVVPTAALEDVLPAVLEDAQTLEITKLKKKVTKLERVNKVKAFKLRRLKKVGTSQRIKTSDDTIMKDVSNQGRMIVELDRNEGVELIGENEKSKEVKDIVDDAQVKGRQGRQAEKQAKIYQIDLDHPSKVLSMQEDDSEVQEAMEVVTTAKLITKVVNVISTPVSAASTIIPTDKPIVPAAAPTVVPVTNSYSRRRKRVIIKDPKEESTPIKPTKTKSMDKGKGIMIEEPKPIKKKDQVELDEEYARKLHEELNKEIDWDMAIEHMKQKAKEDKIEEDQRAIESIKETPAQKAAKRQKLNKKAKEIEDLKQHLEIVPDKDDDVYIEATPLTRKVRVVGYQVILINNKPRYKIIKADETHRLYTSFITLLKNFDRDDLETLWNIVKERFSTSKPNNFLDKYLLINLKTMFGRPDGQDTVWKSQISVHGQAKVKSQKLLTSCDVHIISVTTTQLILLVERRYLLSKFTLEHMVNVVRLQVEEQSEMSLELLRNLKENTKCVNADAEELSAANHKLMLLVYCC
uniref:Synaptobrevin, longin-like domain protein n=1 Tax=Tanacetum cinerariifolium TaxID=118510 RepID=A0A6L2M2N5_TANCI|nr:hypothetical protein [Tanacetum cinerariifolium]GEU67830.1 hypothetical protein [Tanacetum cinerariifolium]